jgi:hypothetical protein
VIPNVSSQSVDKSQEKPLDKSLDKSLTLESLPPALLQMFPIFQENGEIMTCFLKLGHSKDRCWDMVFHTLQFSVFSHLLTLPKQTLHESFPLKSVDGTGHELFDMAIPTYMCDFNDVRRVGAWGEGGKWLCFLPDGRGDPCIVYSMGSNNLFDFEEGIRKWTNKGCQVHTFDCTIAKNTTNEFTTFHPWCIGKDGLDGDRIFKTFKTVMKDLGHKRVHFLKFDIEGFEYDLMDEFLREENADFLPEQLSWEWHDGISGAPATWHGDEVDDKKLAQTDTDKLFTVERIHKDKPLAKEEVRIGQGGSSLPRFVRYIKMLDKVGYRIALKERNNNGGCCTEFTAVRRPFKLLR